MQNATAFMVMYLPQIFLVIFMIATFSFVGFNIWSDYFDGSESTREAVLSWIQMGVVLILLARGLYIFNMLLEHPDNFQKSFMWFDFLTVIVGAIGFVFAFPIGGFVYFYLIVGFVSFPFCVLIYKVCRLKESERVH